MKIPMFIITWIRTLRMYRYKPIPRLFPLSMGRSSDHIHLVPSNLVADSPIRIGTREQPMFLHHRIILYPNRQIYHSLEDYLTSQLPDTPIAYTRQFLDLRISPRHLDMGLPRWLRLQFLHLLPFGLLLPINMLSHLRLRTLNSHRFIHLMVIHHRIKAYPHLPTLFPRLNLCQ